MNASATPNDQPSAHQLLADFLDYIAGRELTVCHAAFDPSENETYFWEADLTELDRDTLIADFLRQVH